jgi:hypothetical protein
MDHTFRRSHAAPRHGAPKENEMAFKELDPVVLERNVPEHELCKGDLGAVVNVDQDGTVDVEFVLASGETEALVHLKPTDLRPIGRRDMLAVRSTRREK